MTTTTTTTGPGLEYVRGMIPRPDHRGERRWNYGARRYRVIVTHHGNGFATAATVEAGTRGTRDRYVMIGETPDRPYGFTDAVLDDVAAIVHRDIVANM